MGKTTGKSISAKEFATLKKGDVYFVKDKNHCRTFERHAKCFAKKGIPKAVNCMGHVNPQTDMRWPTVEEAADYKCGHKETDTKTDTKTVSAGKAIDMSSSKCGVVSQAITTVKVDGADAMWRTAAKQSTHAIRAPLAALLAKKLPTGVAGLVLSQLDTAHGEALLSFIVGHTMPMVPQFCSDARLMRLAREMRVGGMSHYTDMVADAVLKPLREQLVEVVKLLPFGNDEE